MKELAGIGPGAGDRAAVSRSDRVVLRDARRLQGVAQVVAWDVGGGVRALADRALCADESERRAIRAVTYAFLADCYRDWWRRSSGADLALMRRFDNGAM